MRSIPVIVQNSASYKSAYAFNQPKFSYASKFENGKVRLLGTFHGCREYACQDFLKRVRNSWSEMSLQSDIDTKHARIITYVGNKSTHESKIASVIRILNLIEKEVGWPLTKVFELTNESFGDNVKMNMFVGCSKWVRSQHMLSLYLLFIRGTYMLPHISRLRSMSGLIKIMKRYKDGEIKASGYQQSQDANYLKKFDEFLIILKNFDELFKEYPMSRNWSASCIGGIEACFTEGITALLHPKSGRDQKLKKRALEIIKREQEK